MRKFDRSVELHCPTCGGTQFEHEEHDETAPVRCAGCGLITSRNDLIAANGENIGAHVDQIAKEVSADLMKQLKNSFKGNKFIKIK